MTLPEGIAFGSLVLGFLAFVYRVGHDEAGKRSRIYTRIDEIKKEQNNKLQSKEICSIVHVEVKEDMKEIKKKVECIPDIKAGIDLLLKYNGLKSGN